MKRKQGNCILKRGNKKIAPFRKRVYGMQPCVVLYEEGTFGMAFSVYMACLLQESSPSDGLGVCVS